MLKRLIGILILATVAVAIWMNTHKTVPEVEPDAATEKAAISVGLQPIIRVENRPPILMTLKERMAVHKVPGVSIAVMRGDKIVLTHTEGVLEEGSDTPVDAETLFQAASISKPAFATILMRYRERYGLDLDTNVNDLLKSWQVPAHDWEGTEDVTLRRLLSHTAGTTVHGFPGYAAGEDVPSLVQLLDGAPPTNTAPILVDLQPGTQYRYSGGGTSVAQLVLEDVSGRQLTDMATEYLFEPTGMTQSVFAQPLPESYRLNAAAPHDRVGEAVPGGAHTYAALAAAGLWTTPSDILKWASSIRKANTGREGEVVSPASARDMLTNPLGPVGVGFFIDEENGARSFGHGGANRGYRANFFVYTESGDGIAVMTNSVNGGYLTREVIHRAAEIYGWDDVQPPVRRALDMPAEALQELAGNFTITTPVNNSATITVEGDTLILSADGYFPSEVLFPEEEDKFFSGVGNSLVFNRNDAGAVTGFEYRGYVKATKDE